MSSFHLSLIWNDSNSKQIPLLVVIILAMLYNRVPKVWTGVSEFITSMQDRNQQPRSVEVV